ncbi:MAG: GNAT family N-acetyltransferase [Fischerella sp.]|nr:GNAT family N-acetyltransferase [Fischerella sp.]
MVITLREINQNNWKECIRLKTTEEQEKFVASNLYSLAESKFYPSSVPLGIYHHETMVGFMMYDRMDSGYQNSGYFIWRFMIDKSHQGKGYGKAAMQAVIKLLQEKPGCKEILIGYKPENVVAEKLYLSLGFQKTGLIEHGDVLVYLPVSYQRA